MKDIKCRLVSNKEYIKIFFVITFIFINIIMLFYCIKDIFVLLSFIATFFIIILGIVKSLYKKFINIDLIIFIFFYFFFFIAPIFQIEKGGFFPNTIPIRLDDIMIANILIAIWTLLYIFSGYIMSPKKIYYSNRVIKKYIKNTYFLLSIVVFIITFSLFKMDFFLGNIGWGAIINDGTILLIMASVLPAIIFANFIFTIKYPGKKKKVNKLKACISIFIFIYYISPFNKSRYYIGFVILALIYLFLNKKIKPIYLLIILSLGIIIIFPVLGMFRNGFDDFNINYLSREIKNQFLTLNFDAYSEFIATLEYVKLNGIVYGKIFLSSILFFIPRVVWPGKSIGAGGIIGNYLLENYSLGFTNVSNPFISDIYLNFGIVGFIISPFIIRYLLNKINNDIVYSIVLGYVIFIARGDFMSSFAYFLGSYIIIYLIPFNNNSRNEVNKSESSIFN